MPAIGAMVDASATESEGLNMNPMSSRTPSYENIVRMIGAAFPSLPERMRYVQRARASAGGFGEAPIRTAAANSAPSGPSNATIATINTSPARLISAAQGTTRDCP